MAIKTSVARIQQMIHEYIQLVKNKDYVDDYESTSATKLSELVQAYTMLEVNAPKVITNKENDMKDVMKRTVAI